MSQPLVWLITGTSTGLGREFVEQLLARGDKVIATSRAKSFPTLSDLKAKGADIIELDVTWPLEKLKEAAAEANKIHGRIDILINNAGYLVSGVIEENTPEQTFEQYNTNVFGGLNVTRAFLPYMRERKSGTVVWIGSLGGFLNRPAGSLYCSSKAAVRSIATCAHQELQCISPSMKATCIDFGHFRTEFLAAGHRATYKALIPEYAPVTQPLEDSLSKTSQSQPGDPKKGVHAAIEIITGTGRATGKPWPEKGVVIGVDSYNVVKQIASQLDAGCETWKEIITSTDYTDSSDIPREFEYIIDVRERGTATA